MQCVCVCIIPSPRFAVCFRKPQQKLNLCQTSPWKVQQKHIPNAESERKVAFPARCQLVTFFSLLYVPTSSRSTAPPHSSSSSLRYVSVQWRRKVPTVPGCDCPAGPGSLVGRSFKNNHKKKTKQKETCDKWGAVGCRTLSMASRWKEPPGKMEERSTKVNGFRIVPIY